MVDIEVYKRTSDDWYPSYKLADGTGLVRVSFMELELYDDTEPTWRVCAWGGDDCGMERDFTNENSAMCCFLEVIGKDDVTLSLLSQLGFKGA